MGLYLRKSFSFGPLRLNMSRGGVGASLGVKGLRVGSGPRGSYLHAGRGGLYYRQKLLSTPVTRSTSGSGASALGLLIIVFLLLVALGVTSQSASSLLLPTLGGFVAILVVAAFVRSSKRRKREEDEEDRRSGWQRFRELIATLTSGEHADRDSVILDEIRHLQEQYWFDFTAIPEEIAEAVWSIASRNASTAESLARMTDEVTVVFRVQEKHRPALRRFVYQKYVWTRALNDQELTADEEAFIHQLEGLWSISGEEVERERRAIADYSKLRGLSKDSLPVVPVSFPLKRGEVVHHHTTGALVESRVTKTWVEEGERKRETEWHPVRSGDIYVTSKRLLVVGGGTTSIDFGRVIEVEVDPNESRISMIADGRKTPFVVEMSDAIYSGAVIDLARQLCSDRRVGDL